jgi:moderate conductance mechanosensitive channel
MRLLAAAGHLLAQDETEAPLTLYQRQENLACSITADPEDSAGSPICRQIFEWTESRFLAENFDAIVTSSVRAIVIVALAFIAQRFLRRAIKRFVREMNDRGIERLSALAQKGPLTDTAPINLARTTMRTETIGGVLHSLSTFVIWGIAALMVLASFGFNLGPLIAGAGIAGVALGFGAQSLVKDFLSGAFMLLEDQFGVGDIVDVGEAVGTVEAISLRSTRIRDISGTLWHVPNGEILRVGNMSQLWSRALLDIGVAYDTDLDAASRVMKQVADDMAAEEDWQGFFFEPADVWGVQALAADEITIRMVAKVTPAKQWAIERELRARIKVAFDTQGIEIPFPQRTIWLRHDDPEGLPLATTATGRPDDSDDPDDPDDPDDRDETDDPGTTSTGGARYGRDGSGMPAPRPPGSGWLGTESGSGS